MATTATDFMVQWKRLSDAEKDTLKEYAEQEMAVLGVENVSAIKYCAANLGR